MEISNGIFTLIADNIKINMDLNDTKLVLNYLSSSIEELETENVSFILKNKKILYLALSFNTKSFSIITQICEDILPHNPSTFDDFVMESVDFKTWDKILLFINSN